jgi:hypothetical protein
MFSSLRFFARLFLALLFAMLSVAMPDARAQTSSTDLRPAYEALKGFDLSGGAATVDNLTLKRDRVEMTFSGTFYFPLPVMGKITGAVFIGRGTFRAEPPPSLFEKENLQRMLKADVVESDFEVAVLRFTDDTFAAIGAGHSPGAATAPAAQALAREFGPRFVRETGASIASRLLLSLIHKEEPGFFLAQFDKGKRGRFTYLLDYQCRIPTVNFTINGGEKGLIFTYNRALFGNDVWLAFYSMDDYQRGQVTYSDAFDLIEIPQYRMDVDLREPRKLLKVRAKTDIVALADGVRVIPFAISEDLPDFEDMRKKNGMRVTSAKQADGSAVEMFQEEWEGGFVLVLPAARRAKDRFALEMEVEGDFIYDRSETYDCHYPFINGEWYPRHGYLARSKFEITFHHLKKHKVAGPGLRVKEEPAPDNANEVLTSYRMDDPVALVTFALGPYKVYQEKRRTAAGTELPMEFFSLVGSRDIRLEVRTSQGIIPITVPLTIKEDFVLAEMGNAVDYMSVLFGQYPYPAFRAAFHPFGFGQGFASMLAIPNADSALKGTFVFLSHETAHQWWGNIVAWRSYRDQWLSEGFAEYSGLLYMLERTKRRSDLRELLGEMRSSLKVPPRTETGIGGNRVTDIGPIILGQRLSSKRSLNAYTILTYNKGALVLRMLHFLFTNPSTGDGKPFFDMLSDFVRRHQNGWATTETFVEVANEHFAKTPIAQRYGLKDLNWFFRQWVWQTHLPSYRLDYVLENQADGKVLVKGTLTQEGAPEDWFMPIPLVFKFGGDKIARGTVMALGARQSVNIMLPARPESVELDPEMWILSDKTVTRR